MKCLHSYPAGTSRTSDVGPTGECLLVPAGAYVGKQTRTVWYFCDKHRGDVREVLAMHAEVRDFPLQEVSAEEAQIWEVMES